MNERRLTCKQWEGKKRERGKKEPVGMAKDFDFQMPVIYMYVTLKSIIQVVDMTTATNFA